MGDIKMKININDFKDVKANKTAKLEFLSQM